jgi:hypothetical protein
MVPLVVHTAFGAVAGEYEPAAHFSQNVTLPTRSWHSPPAYELGLFGSAQPVDGSAISTDDEYCAVAQNPGDVTTSFELISIVKGA